MDKETLENLMNVFDKIGISCNFIGAYNSYACKMDKCAIDDVKLWFHEEAYILEKWEIENVKANILDIYYKEEAQLKRCITYFSDMLIFNKHSLICQQTFLLKVGTNPME